MSGGTDVKPTDDGISVGIMVSNCVGTTIEYSRGVSVAIYVVITVGKTVGISEEANVGSVRGV